MTQSFKDPNVRSPNFGVEGAFPMPRPWWADPEHWNLVPPAAPPWSPSPSVSPDSNPFGDPPQMPAPPPLRPTPNRERASGGSGLLDWLLRAGRADRDWDERRLPSTLGTDGLAPDYMDRRPWQPDQLDPDLFQLQPQPFNSEQLKALLRRRPQPLLLPTGDRSSRGRSIQPPIFFPFD
jgi:hypothetical protein